MIDFGDSDLYPAIKIALPYRAGISLPFCLKMRRLALSALGFSGAFTPLMSPSFLSEAVGDGLDGDRLPALSSLLLNLAPFGLTLWIVPALIAAGVYLKSSEVSHVGDALWGIVGAILVFSCVTGALVASYNHFLFLDGPDRSPHSLTQWVSNIALIWCSGGFLATGLRKQNPRTGLTAASKPDSAAS